MRKIIPYILLLVIFFVSQLLSAQESQAEIKISIQNLKEQGQTKKADQVVWSVINSNDSTFHQLRTALIGRKLESSKMWQKETIKYLKNKKISDKLSILQAVEPLSPDSIFFVSLNKDFTRLDLLTKNALVDWLTCYNQNNNNINTLYIQDKLVELFYTCKDPSQKLAIGKCLQTYANELSLLVFCNLLKSESVTDIDMAAKLLYDFHYKDMNKELRKILLNNRNEFQKIAILEIYQYKKDSDTLPEVITLLSSDFDDNIQAEAYRTIAIIADKKQLETLQVLYENAPTAYKHLLVNKIEELKLEE